LNQNPNLPDGKEGVAQAIEHLGYVQIDTISVIERAHKHTIWNRCPDFTDDLLHELLAVDRRIQEYWGHAHSYLPMKDFRYTLPLKERRSDPKSAWHKRITKLAGHLKEPVMKRIRTEGPVSSKDFKDVETVDGGWGNYKHTSIALDLLFMEGYLMVTERQNFQRYYDLTERVLPVDIDTSMPTSEELGRYLVETTLRAYGLATDREIRDHIQLGLMEDITAGLEAMADSGEIVPVEVNGIDNQTYYAYPETLNNIDSLTSLDSHVKILSPFDNLFIQRDRMERLFDFHYRLECYTPKDKRIYGYFVLPVLYGQQFAARLDAKNNRKTKTFIIRNLLVEEGFEQEDDFLPHLANAVQEFAEFNDCNKYKFEKISPKHIQKPLISMVE
jgi:uncharacterized protein YcaQ